MTTLAKIGSLTKVQKYTFWLQKYCTKYCTKQTRLDISVLRLFLEANFIVMVADGCRWLKILTHYLSSATVW